MQLLSEYIISLRQESGLDQKDFANSLGTNQATISNIENGKYDSKIPSSKIINLLALYKNESQIKIMENFIDTTPNPSRIELFARSPFSSFETYRQLFTSFASRLEYLRVGTQTLPTELFNQSNFLSFDIIGKYKSSNSNASLISFFTTAMSLVAQKYVHYQEIRDMSTLSKFEFETWFLSWNKRYDFYKVVIDEMFRDSIFYGSKKSRIIIFVFNENNEIEKQAFEYLRDNLDVTNLPPFYYTLFLYRDGSIKSADIKEFNQLKNIFYIY